MNRETAIYSAKPSARGTRITIKRRHHYPVSRVVHPSVVRQLEELSDREFDAACSLELGIGIYSTP